MIKTLSALAMGLLLATAALAAPQKACCDAVKSGKKAACCPGPCCAQAKPKTTAKAHHTVHAAHVKHVSKTKGHAARRTKKSCCPSGKCCPGGKCCG